MASNNKTINKISVNFKSSLTSTIPFFIPILPDGKRFFVHNDLNKRAEISFGKPLTFKLSLLFRLGLKSESYVYSESNNRADGNDGSKRRSGHVFLFFFSFPLNGGGGHARFPASNVITNRKHGSVS